MIAGVSAGLERSFRCCRMIWQALSCEAYWPVYTPADVSDPSFRSRRRLIFSTPGSSGRGSSNLYILPTNPCQHWAERYICTLNYLDCHLCIFNAPVSFFPFMALWNTTVSPSLHLPPCVCVCGRKILNRRSFIFEAQQRHIVAVGRHAGVGATYSLDVWIDKWWMDSALHIHTERQIMAELSGFCCLSFWQAHKVVVGSGGSSWFLYWSP